MSYAKQETLKELAKRNRRGMPTSEVVFEILDIRSLLEELETAPEDTIGKAPEDCTAEEWIRDNKYFWNCALGDALAEIKRRRHINETCVKAPEREIIGAIKAAMPIVNVIEWYCKVFYSSRSELKFQCTLHGEDKSPSGVIYTKESRWWCFGCNKGGDVLDAVQAFEKVDLPQAIKKLATHLGIELRPLTQAQPKKNEKRLQELHGES